MAAVASALSSRPFLLPETRAPPLLHLRRCSLRRAFTGSRGFPRSWTVGKLKADNRRFFHSAKVHFSKDATGSIPSTQVNTDDIEDDEACELVSGAELLLGDGEDAFYAYILKAVKNNNGCGILLLSDIFGFEDSSTREFAYRVACSGYNVLLPDLFRGNPWNNEHRHTDFEQWLSKQSAERIAKDISTSAKWMTDEFLAAGVSKKLGIIGFSFGGEHLIKTLAQDEEALFGTGICFYGTSIDQSLARDLKVPVLFIGGDSDQICPVNILRNMERDVEGSKVVIYKNRGHGFVHRPGSQEEDEDAENAFVTTRNWLHDFLAVNKKE